MYDIPDLAEKMADQMGFVEGHPKRKFYIHKISKSLFEKNRDQMTRVMEQLIKAEDPESEYCSMTAMMLGLMDVRKMVKGNDVKDHARNEDYFYKMKEARRKAEEIEKTDYAKGIRYRADMAKKWSKIVRAQIPLKDKSIDEISSSSNVFDLSTDGVNNLQKNIQSRSGTTLTQKLNKFEEIARRKGAK
jgi:hypothetical protein